MTAKILIYDIERFPNNAWIWDRFDIKFVPMDMIKTRARTCAVGAKWVGAKTTMYTSEFHEEGGHEAMVRKAHSWFEEADIIVGFNNKSFDRRHLKTAFEQYGLRLHSPVKEVDLYQVVKRNLKLPSNRLTDVAKELGLTQLKMEHEGFLLWVKCMEGDEKAWSRFRRYCKQDVAVTEELYHRILHLIPGHPHLGLYTDDDNPVCGQCGSERPLQRRGFERTNLGKFQRYQCTACSKFSRGKRALMYVEERPV